EGDWSVASGQRAMKALLDLPEPPTAVFACNDFMAIGAIDVAHTMGYNIPETMLIRPKLTTLAQHPAEIGRKHGEALFERIEGLEGPRRTFEIPIKLIERDST